MECNNGKSHTRHMRLMGGAKYACIQIYHINDRSDTFYP